MEKCFFASVNITNKLKEL